MYNPETYDWYQCDEENYDSGTPPDEQMATEPVQADEQDANRDALLQEYRAGAKVADDYWKVYLETKSGNAFGNYVAVNQRLSAIFAELAGMGMSLEEIRG